MPNLDVSSVLTDPLFADMSLRCIRQRQTVGTDGIAVNTPVPVPFSGVVTAASGTVLEREAEGSRVSGSINIVTRFWLEDGKNSLAADIVTWKGRRYTVADVQDYSRYGPGFIQATCELLPITGGR
jgi:galactose-6-phosphate isomerase